MGGADGVAILIDANHLGAVFRTDNQGIGRAIARSDPVPGKRSQNDRKR